MKEQLVRQGDMCILYDSTAGLRVTPDFFDRETLRKAGMVECKTKTGRTPAIFFTADGGFRLVLKHYRRGGWVRKFVEDSYCYVRETAVRSFRELRLLSRLQAMDLSVPVPLAACYRRYGMRYTADLITFRCGDTQPLSSVLEGGHLPAERWYQLGQTLRRFHDSGVRHVDLTAHNILLGGKENSKEIFLIDFDRARIVNVCWQGGVRLPASLRKLRRSLSRLQRRSRTFTYEDADFERLLAGYRSS